MFPQYSTNARKGEAGVHFVSNIVFNNFGWIFRRTPQEFDFGVDGHIDVVLQDKSVTGQQCAVQIKYGESYFEETNQWGYIFRGENKHLSYLQNYPVPVLIVLCNPKTNECHWAKFDLRSVEPTNKSWKIVIPKANRLLDDKSKILKILPEIDDPTEKIAQYKRFRDVATTSDFIWYQIDHQYILNRDVSGVRELFDRLRATQDVAVVSAGKVEISFDGYDSDERELWEIQEVRDYVKTMAAAAPEILFFASIDKHSTTLSTIVFCVTDTFKGEIVDDDEVEIFHNKQQISQFVVSNLDQFNELNHWTNRGYDDCKNHYRLILDRVGLLQGLSEDDVEHLIRGK